MKHDNNEDRINNALLRLNEEYAEVIESKEYNLGRRIYKYADILKHFRINELAGRISIEKKRKRSRQFGFASKSRHFYAKGEAISSVKGAVYSCITAGYDAPHPPYYYPDTCTFVLFTDDAKLSADSGWVMRSTSDREDNILTLSDTEINRYYKMNPHSLFPEFDYAVYVDGNVAVVGDVSRLFAVARDSVIGIAMHEHPGRCCAYDEGEACKVLQKGDPEKITAQLERYRKEGFPKKYGLCEATVIVTDLRNPISRKIYADWWEEYLKSGSLRDQLAFPYVLWKNGYKITDVGDLGSDRNKNPYFRMDLHL